MVDAMPMPTIMPNMASGPETQALDPGRGSRIAAGLCALAMVVLGLGWELWWAPTGYGSWAIKVLPMAVCLRGLFLGRLRTHRWACLLVWLYFCEGVVRAVTESGWSAALAAAQAGLSLLLFAAAVIYVRTVPAR
jgi:uncharacterized membrane protein